MSWQDPALAALAFWFMLALVPTLNDPDSVVPGVTSATTASGLYALAYILYTLDLHIAMVGNLLAAAMWTGIFVWRRPW